MRDYRGYFRSKDPLLFLGLMSSKQQEHIKEEQQDNVWFIFLFVGETGYGTMRT